MITIFYDGHCNLCDKEIRYYQGIADPNKIHWVDIQDNKQLSDYPIDFDEAMRLFTCLDTQGNKREGVDAFICLWHALPYWHYLARVVALPGCYQLTKLVYARFAKWRYDRAMHCSFK